MTKQYMNLRIRISTDECGNPRITKEEFMKEATNGNIAFGVTSNASLLLVQTSKNNKIIGCVDNGIDFSEWNE